MKSYKIAFSLTWHRSDNPLKGVLFHPSANIGIFFAEKTISRVVELKGGRSGKNTYINQVGRREKWRMEREEG